MRNLRQKSRPWVFLLCTMSMVSLSLRAASLGTCAIRYAVPHHQAHQVALNPVFTVGFKNIWSLDDCQSQLQLVTDQGRSIPLHRVLAAEWQGNAAGQSYAYVRLVPEVWLERNRRYQLMWQHHPYASFRTGRQSAGRMVSFSPAAFPLTWCPRRSFYSSADIVSCLSGLHRSHPFLSPLITEALSVPRGFPVPLKITMARYTGTLPSGDVFLRHAWVIYPQGTHFSSLVVLPGLRNVADRYSITSFALALIAAEKGYIAVLPYALNQENTSGHVGTMPDTFDLNGAADNAGQLVEALRNMPPFVDALKRHPDVQLYGAGLDAPAALATMQWLLKQGLSVGHVFLSRGLFNAYAESEVHMESLRYGMRSETSREKTYFARPQDFLVFLKKFAWAKSYWGLVGVADPFYLSHPLADFSQDYLVDFAFEDRSVIHGLLADVSLADSSYAYDAPRALVHFYRFRPISLMFSRDIVDALSSPRLRLGAVTGTICHGTDTECDILAARDFIRALPIINADLGASDSWDTSVHNQDFDEGPAGPDNGVPVYDQDDNGRIQRAGDQTPPSGGQVTHDETSNNTVIVVGQTYWDHHDHCDGCYPGPYYYRHHHHHHHGCCGPDVIPSQPGFPAGPGPAAVIPSQPGFPAGPAVIPSQPGFPAGPAVIPAQPGIPARHAPVIPAAAGQPARRGAPWWWHPGSVSPAGGRAAVPMPAVRPSAQAVRPSAQAVPARVAVTQRPEVDSMMPAGSVQLGHPVTLGR